MEFVTSHPITHHTTPPKHTSRIESEDDPNGATTPTTTTATTSAGPVAATEATTESTTGSVNRSLEYVGFKSNYIVAKWWVKFDKKIKLKTHW